MKEKGRNKILHLLAVCIFLPFLFNCSMKAERQSFSSNLDEIDALINQRQYKDAVKELEQLEKRGLSSWDTLSIFKRYEILDEKEKAEKLLKNSIKKNPENLELNAVYTDFLLQKGDFESAIQSGKVLKETKFGSLYSEAIFLKTEKATSSENMLDVFNSSDFFENFQDAYNGTGNNGWLRNCAILSLSKGAYDAASSIRPEEISDDFDGYFWALTMFDGAKYGDAINYSDAAKNIIYERNQKNLKINSLSSILSLEQDSYTKLKDQDSAQIVREELLSDISSGDSWIVPENTEEELIPVVFANCARYELDSNQMEKCYDYLNWLVNIYKDFVPGLSLYSQFALETNKPEETDELSLVLRDEGTLSLEMEKYDNRLKVPLSDALFRIEDSVGRTHDSSLYILDLEIRSKTDSDLNNKEKTRKIWEILENNALKPGIYPDILVDYSARYLLSIGESEEAEKLVKNNIFHKYEIESGSDFIKACVEKMHEMTRREVEYAAYFAARKLLHSETLALYENAVYEVNPVTGKLSVSPSSSDYSCVNLANIYHSVGKDDEALELYAKVENRAVNLKLKSEIMYRTAMIYFGRKDYRNARRSAEYAVTLNQENAKARLLLSKIKVLN